MKHGLRICEHEMFLGPRGLPDNPGNFIPLPDFVSRTCQLARSKTRIKMGWN